ncbi:MAG: Phage tail protein, partial [Candidatus Eremiobacteraeota bacterium]|nr:Phage tail protein [Candidatus Eremiobacteraeota bacterium]
NPFLQARPAGGSGNDITLQLTKTMAGGDTIVIDCDPRNRINGVLLNGLPRLDLISMTGSINRVGDAAFFPYLAPGGNNLATSSGGTSVTITWHEAYLF